MVQLAMCIYYFFKNLSLLRENFYDSGAKINCKGQLLQLTCGLVPVTLGTK